MRTFFHTTTNLSSIIQDTISQPSEICWWSPNKNWSKQWPCQKRKSYTHQKKTITPTIKPPERCWESENLVKVVLLVAALLLQDLNALSSIAVSSHVLQQLGEGWSKFEKSNAGPHMIISSLNHLFSLWFCKHTFLLPKTNWIFKKE